MPFAPAPRPEPTAPDRLAAEREARLSLRREPTGAEAIRLRWRVLAAPFAVAIPTVAAASAIIAVLMTRRLRPVPVDASLVELALPAALAVAFDLAWARRRIRIVKEETRKKGSAKTLCHLAAVIALAVPAGVTSHVAIRQAARLVRVPDGAAIAARLDASYVAVDEPCLAKAGRRVFGRAIRTGGKKRRYLDLERYVAVPFCPAADDPAGAPAWLALSWSVRLPSTASDVAREQSWKALVARSEDAFARADLADFAWLEEVGTDDRNAWVATILGEGEPERDPAVSPRGPLRILRAHREPFEAWRGGIAPAILAVAIAWAAWCLVALVVPLDARECRRWRSP